MSVFFLPNKVNIVMEVCNGVTFYLSLFKIDQREYHPKNSTDRSCSNNLGVYSARCCG